MPPAFRLALLALAFPCSAFAADLLRRPQRDDAADGSRDKPLRTLEAARRLARRLKEQGPVTVYLRGGLHSPQGSVPPAHRNSGTEKAPITYRAWGDERRCCVWGGRSRRAIGSASMMPRC